MFSLTPASEVHLDLDHPRLRDPLWSISAHAEQALRLLGLSRSKQTLLYLGPTWIASPLGPGPWDPQA